MVINFEFYLFLATILSGLMWLIHRLLPMKNFLMSIMATVGSLFGVLLLVLVIRSFLAEPFRIPSGSMLPTLEIGDFILVNKFAYGLRLPVFRKQIWDFGKPQHGDVVVFKYPRNPSQDFIKRVVGVAGDTIEYKNKVVYVNGVKVGQEVIGKADEFRSYPAMKLEETLPDRKYEIYVYPTGYTGNGKWEVPSGHYFVMGDNRDNSNDSRVWGFVPETNLIGHAFLVWMHWNLDDFPNVIDFSRIGKSID